MRQQQVMAGNRFHDNIQAAVNATQEMLMRQNLNDPTSPQSVTGKKTVKLGTLNLNTKDFVFNSDFFLISSRAGIFHGPPTSRNAAHQVII